MILNEAHFIYFSPTHTSKQIGQAIVRGIAIKGVSTTNLTLKPSHELVLPSSVLTIIAVPVYGGRVAPLALERLKAIRGTDTPVVLAVVYGNRAYEKALVELDGVVSQQGFKVIAGATFVGEHSFSTQKHPIAADRPNVADLDFAIGFGQKIQQKLSAASTLETLYGVDVRAIQRPRQPIFPLLGFLRKVLALRRNKTLLPPTPWVEDAHLCTHCGACVATCPAEAIERGAELYTDAQKCIRCCACVKGCTSKARVYDTPFSALLARYFAKQKEPQKIV